MSERAALREPSSAGGDGGGAASTVAAGKRPRTAAIQRRTSASPSVAAIAGGGGSGTVAGALHDGGEHADDPFGFHLATPAPVQRKSGAVVQRKAMPAGADDAGPPPAGPANRVSNVELAREALAEGNPVKARRPELVATGYIDVSAADRYALIKLLCDRGPDARALEALWNSYGSSGLGSQYAADGGVYFDKSLEAGADLWAIAAVKRMHADFEADVTATALAYLAKNEEYMAIEQARLGLRGGAGGPDGGVGGTKQADEQAARLEEVKRLAALHQRVEEGRERLLAINVGYDVVQLSQGRGPAYRGTMPRPYTPGRRPEQPPRPEDLASGHMQRWDDVDDSYRILTSVIHCIGVQSPAVYAAAARGNTGDLASGLTAKDTAQDSLLDAQRNIAKTRAKLASGALDWRDLQPIHQQLFAGKPGGRRDWSKGLEQSVARGLLKGHEDRQFWISLGFSSLAAAAFVVSELASGGLATAGLVAGIGIGAGQAASSWMQYAALAGAARSSVSDELTLVTQGQADAQRLTAIVDTVFVAMDAGGAAWSSAKAAMRSRKIVEAGVEAAGEATGARMLRGFESLATRNAQVEAIQRGLEELGVEGVARESGKSAEQLAEIVGRDSAEGRKILALGGAGGHSAAVQLTEDSIASALDRMGPVKTLEKAGGYEKVAKALGNDSPAARRIFEWRNKVERELIEYMGAASEDGIKSTGRRVMSTNDMDMSTLGAGATEAREQARNWLAARLGVDAEKVEKLVGGQLFTDPRRLHMYEALPANTRALIDQETQKVAIEASQNLRLAKAIEAKDRVLERKIREQMEAMGMKEVKVAKLSDAERLRLGHEIDELHAQLVARLERKEPAEDLARGIAQRQGVLNASEDGAYISGGGGRANVTARAGDELTPAYEAGRPGAVMSKAEAVGRMFEEQRFLDGVVQELRGASDPAAIAAAIKKVGKYGGRDASSAAAFVANAEKLEALTGKFAALQRRAEAGEITRALEQGVKAAVEEAQLAVGELSRIVEDNLVAWAAEAGIAKGSELALVQAKIIWGMNVKAAVLAAAERYAYAGRLIAMGVDPRLAGEPPR